VRVLAADSVDALERQAQAAADAWDTASTEFLAPELVASAETRLQQLADVGYLKVGGYPAASRCRFVFTNRELDGFSDPAEYVTVLQVSADFDKADPLPNLLVGIGVGLGQIGDLRIDRTNNIAYIVAATGATEKAVQRLLPKVLPGTVLINALELEADGELEGELLEMSVERLDRRKQKR